MDYSFIQPRIAPIRGGPSGVSSLESALSGHPLRRGKVRDVYDLGDRILLIATDRISAFDWVLPTLIPDKGRVLTTLSAFWFERLGVPHHLLALDPRAAGVDFAPETLAFLEGRVMVVRPAEVIPFECVVRGYLAGSGWKEYRANGTVCGVSLPGGLVESARIEPIFTPATKAVSGHDENVSFEVMAGTIGIERASQLRDLSLSVYRAAADYAAGRGLILADTKLEWGIARDTGELLLIDEVLTPDSSRYWASATYRPGGSPPSFDKQFVRDWLETTGWDKASPPPALPEDVVASTRARYVEAFEILTGNVFPWR